MSTHGRLLRNTRDVLMSDNKKPKKKGRKNHVWGQFNPAFLRGGKEPTEDQKRVIKRRANGVR